MSIGVSIKFPGGAGSGLWRRVGGDIENTNPDYVKTKGILLPERGIELNKVSGFSKITDGGETLWIRVQADGVWEIFGLVNDLVDLSDFYDELSHVNLLYVKSRTGKKELAFTLSENPGAIALGIDLNNPTGASLTASSYTIVDTGKFQIDFLDQDSDPINIFNAFSYPIKSGDTLKCDVIFDGVAKEIKGYVEYYVNDLGTAIVNSYDAAMQPANGIIPPDYIFRFDLYNQ